MSDDNKILIFPGPSRSIAAEEYDDIRAEYIAALKVSLMPVTEAVPSYGFFRRKLLGILDRRFGMLKASYQNAIKHKVISAFYLMLGSALVLGVWAEYMYPVLDALDINHVDLEILPTMNACFLVGSYLSMIYSLFIACQQEKLLRALKASNVNTSY